LGKGSTAQLFDGVADGFLYPEIKLADGVSESEVVQKCEILSQKNRACLTTFTGAGIYRHSIPAKVKAFANSKEILSANSIEECENSQGILQGVYECQQMLSALTGMQITSLCALDSAVALAMACLTLKEEGKNKVLISALVKPHVKKVLEGYLAPHGISVQAVESLGARINADTLGQLLSPEIIALYVEQPNYLGTVEDMQKLCDMAHSVGAKFIAGVYPVSLALLKKPCEYGADVAVGDCQSLGLGSSHGSNTLGFISVNGEYHDKLPGAYVKISEDASGNRAYCVKKANNALLNCEVVRRALTVGAYLCHVGADGLKKIASISASNAHYLKFELAKAGIGVKYRDECFNEFVTLSKCSSESILTALAEAGMVGGHKLGTHEILWCTTELSTREQMDKCAEICGEVNQ